MQRLFDFIFSFLAIIVLFPFLMIIFILLRLTGEGEIFFLQERIGKNKEKFKLFKFATMLKNSENIGTGTVTLRNDPRILPLGGFLRKTKMNELPQLFNILKGDMSIIGPRPQTQRCFNAFPKKAQQIIVKVRPGLSGIGSIIFRSEEELMDDSNNAESFYDDVIMPYKALLEEWYVNNNSLYVYFGLIIITILAVLFPKTNIVWKLFKSLPKPSSDLRDML